MILLLAGTLIGQYNLILSYLIYAVTKLSIGKIMEHQMSVKSSFGLSVKDDDYDLPLEFRIPIKQRATKPLSNILPSILTAVKMGLQKYHDICFSRSGVNEMWILKNSKYLLETLSSRSQCLTALTHLIYLPQFLIRY